jgi:hypothetical protein
LQIPQTNSAPEARLRSVSLGGSSATRVWAVDVSNRLYLRKEVTVVFPEGTVWEQVATDVKSISASETGELWAVLDRVTPDSVVTGLVDALVGTGSPASSTMADARGVLVRRSGITPGHPTGTGWDIALGVSDMALCKQFQILRYLLKKSESLKSFDKA